MPEFGAVLKISSLTLFAVEIASVVRRLRVYNDRREPLYFLVLLGLLAALVIVPPVPYLTEFLVLGLIFVMKSYAAFILPYRRDGIYNFVFGALVLIFTSLIPLQLHRTVSYQTFFLIVNAVLFIPVLLLMRRLSLKLEKRGILLIAVLIALFFIARRVEETAGLWRPSVRIAGDVLLLVLAAFIAWLLFEEEYFIAGSMRGLASSLEAERRLAAEMSSRLDRSEETIIAQDRFVSAGVLAGGVSHEFKNIISLIGNCAHYGLLHADPERKDEGFRLIQEHVDHSLQSVIRVLDRIRARGKNEAREIDVGEFVSRLARVTRAAYRSAGIAVRCDAAGGVRASVRPDDLEQIILNIVRNAAAAFGTRRTAGESGISLRVLRRPDGRGVIEIEDNAGGIREAEALCLFEPRGSSSRSTGMGLYLTRLLAEQNGLSLGYRPGEGGGGSVFAVDFAAAAETGGRDGRPPVA